MADEVFKMRVQVLDSSNGVVFQAEVVAPQELFRAPGSSNSVDGLLGLKTALDYTIDRVGVTRAQALTITEQFS